MATFKERIKELRKDRHLSQRELADALHLSSSSVAMYETGKRQPGYLNTSSEMLINTAFSGIFSCSEIGKCSKFVANELKN